MNGQIDDTESKRHFQYNPHALLCFIHISTIIENFFKPIPSFKIDDSQTNYYGCNG
jgi:hypothetical protein